MVLKEKKLSRRLQKKTLQNETFAHRSKCPLRRDAIWLDGGSVSALFRGFLGSTAIIHIVAMMRTQIKVPFL